jgi:hypothetical protein
MADIEVTRIDDDTFRVEVRDGGSATVHEVSATPDDLRQYGGDVESEQLIRATFEFLLERESKEEILSRFALTVVERYFPEFPREIRGRVR